MEMKALRSPAATFEAWSSAELQASTQDNPDVAIGIVEGGVHLPPVAALVPSRLSTLGAALRSGTGKFVGQAISSGVGELAGTGVRIGLELADSIPSARIPMLAAKGTMVVVTGGLAGFRAGKSIEEGYGVSNGVRAAVTLVPVLVPAGLALGTGLSGGSLVAASVVLGECIARMTSSGVRDLLNEVGRGAIGDTRAVDSGGRPLTHRQAVDRRATVGMLAPMLPNIGVSALGQLALPGKHDGATGDSAHLDEGATDPFNDDLAGVASAAIVKGGYALMLEGGRAAAAIADGGGLEYVPGEGLSAISRNLRDFKGTAKRAYEHTSMRIAMGALSGDLPSVTGAPWYATSILQGMGEVRSGLVERAQAGREDIAQDEAVVEMVPEDTHAGGSTEAHGSQSPLSPSLQRPSGQLMLPGYVEREDSRGSAHSDADLPVAVVELQESQPVTPAMASQVPEFPEPMQEEEPPAGG